MMTGCRGLLSQDGDVLMGAYSGWGDVRSLRLSFITQASSVPQTLHWTKAGAGPTGSQFSVLV